MPTTTGSRDGAIKTRYEHLATKADLHAIETRLVKWLFGMMFGGMAAAAAIASAVAALLG